MTEEQQQLLIKKIDGELTPEGERQFAYYLQQDANFAREYALQQGMIAALQSDHEQQLKQQFQAVYRQVEVRHQRRRTIYYRIAAVISLLLLITCVWFYSSDRAPAAPQLFARYYTPYQAAPLVRSKTPDGPYQRASDLYRDGRYDEAIPLLKDALATDTSRQDKLQLLLGNSYLQTDSVALAITRFQAAASSDNMMMQQFGRWYLALSYLRAGDTEAARTILTRISSEPGMYQSKAQQLLQALPT